MINLIFLLAIGAKVAGAPAAADKIRSPLESVVVERISQSLPEGLAIADVVLPRTFSLLAGVELEAEWKSAPRAGIASVVLVLRRAGRVVDRSWCRVRLVAISRAAVLLRDMRASEVITERDIQIVKRPSDDAADPETIIGARMLVALAAGTTVERAMVAVAPPIARGTPVRIESRRGVVMIMANGVLEKTARAGETATVRLVDGKVRVQGRLLSGGVVLVEGGGQ